VSVEVDGRRYEDFLPGDESCAWLGADQTAGSGDVEASRG